jgi:hypothetical protein
MSLLVDIVLDVLSELIPPASRKGGLVVAAAIAFAFALVIAWLIFVVPDPLNQPRWGLAALACSIVYGSGGAIASVVNLRSDEPNRAASVVLLVWSLALIAMPVSLLL